MLNKKKTFPLTLALLLSLGVYIEPTRAVNHQDLIVAQAPENETTLSLPDSVTEDSVMPKSDRQKRKQMDRNLEQKFAEKYSGAIAEVTSTNSDAEAITNTTEAAPTSQNGSRNLLLLLLPLGLLIPLLAFLIKKGLSSKTETSDYTRSEKELVGLGIGNSSSASDRDSNGMATGTDKKAMANRRRRQSNTSKTFKFDDTVNRSNPVRYMSAELDNSDVPNTDDATQGVSKKFNKIDPKLSLPKTPNVDGTTNRPNQVSDMNARPSTPNLPKINDGIKEIRKKAGNNFNEQNTYILDPTQDQAEPTTTEMPNLDDLVEKKSQTKGNSFNEQHTYILDPTQDQAEPTTENMPNLDDLLEKIPETKRNHFNEQPTYILDPTQDKAE